MLRSHSYQWEALFGFKALALLLQHTALGRALGEHFSNLHVSTGFLQVLMQCRFWFRRPGWSLRCCTSNKPPKIQKTCWLLAHTLSSKAFDQWFSNRDSFAPWGHLAMCGDISDCHTTGGEATGCCRWRSVMLLNILQLPGQAPNPNKHLPSPECQQ